VLVPHTALFLFCRLVTATMTVDFVVTSTVRVPDNAGRLELDGFYFSLVGAVSRVIDNVKRPRFDSIGVGIVTGVNGRLARASTSAYARTGALEGHGNTKSKLEGGQSGR
jgi:hypothetical protein